MQINKQTRSFTVFSVILGAILFTYLLLRSIFVEPIHDEIATLFHYIDYGTIWGDGIVLDANNHLLNSFLGKICYSIFGDHFWAMRLPNVVSFLLFFYAAFKIAGFLRYEYLKYIFLIAMTCIPYVLDYFAYCRGYGMSMAFLMMAVYLFIQINKEYNTGKVIVLSLMLILGIYANLNLLITAILIFGYTGIKLIAEVKQKNKYRQFYYFLGIASFTAISLYPALSFASMLKESGALYYGNKDGLWLTTGATLSKCILFSTSLIIKYLLIIVIVLLIVHVFYSLKTKGAHAFFQSPSTLFTGLFIGNLIAIELMRWLLDTNYPEDRVGMQLIFFFTGAVLFSIQHYTTAAWLSFSFILFPLVGWEYFNFKTSVFSPDDRMEKQDFDLFTKEMRNDKSSTVYLTQKLAYAYHVRKNNPTDFHVPSMFRSGDTYTEEIVSSKDVIDVNDKKVKEYDLLRYNPRTGQKILRRKKQFNWQVIETSVVEKETLISTSDVFYNLIDSSWKNSDAKNIKITIESKVYTPDLNRETLVIVVDKTDTNGVNSYDSFNLNWAAGKNREYTFKKAVEFSPAGTKELKIYLYNPNEFNYTILDKKVVFKASE